MSTPFHDQADRGAAFLGLGLDPAYRDGVAAQLDLLSRHAALAMALPLPPESEPAPVFVP